MTGVRGRAVPSFSAVLVVVLAGWFLATGRGLQLQVLACWLAVAGFASMMAYFALQASRQMAPGDFRRRFWTALGIASAIFAVGEWAQLAAAVTAPRSAAALTGTGVVRTVALGVGCTLLTVVVLTYPIPHRSARERLCHLLDLATVVTAAGTYGLYWTVSSVGADRSLVANDLVTLAAAPVVAMLTAFAVGRLYLSKRAPFTWHIGVLGPFAAVVEALSRALGPELLRVGRPGVIFAMTVASHGLLMIASWAQWRSVGAGRRVRETTSKRPFSLLPYVALGATFGLLVVILAVKGFDRPGWVAVAGLAAITGVVVARQLTSFIDNAQLLRERDVLAARLHTMAFTDSLTGPANRAQFHERLDAALRRDGGEVAVLLIDLDDFKPVNDRHGHAAGDAVLITTADRMRAGVGPAGLIARLGGDEFAVLVDRAQEVDPAAVAQRIVAAVDEPCRLPDGPQVRVRASVGVAVATGDRNPSALLHRADEAMYAAKCAGKGAVRLAG